MRYNASMAQKLHTFTFRITYAEKRQLARSARSSGCSVAEYVRRASLGYADGSQAESEPGSSPTEKGDLNAQQAAVVSRGLP